MQINIHYRIGKVFTTLNPALVEEETYFPAGNEFLESVILRLVSNLKNVRKGYY
jgi:hypothetical protein